VTAITIGNYTLNQGGTVTAAALYGPRAVVLTTGTQIDATVYTLAVSEVKDRSAAANAINPAQNVNFTALATFYEDFENGLRPVWLPAGSATWNVVTGNGGHALAITATPTDILRINRTYGSFTLDAEVRAPEASTFRHVMIVFGYTDANNYYAVDFAGARHASYNGIFKTTSGTSAKLIGDDVEATITDSTRYYKIRVEVDAAAKTIRAFCDNYTTPVFVTSIPAYTNGQIGVWSNKGKYGFFDNIIITQYVRAGAWAGIADNAASKQPAQRGVSIRNPASVRSLQAAGWQVYTLQGTIPAAGYQGVVILRNNDGSSAGKAVVVGQ
jgi:hypothetical protein